MRAGLDSRGFVPRESKPGLLLKDFTELDEAAVQDKQLDSAGITKCDFGGRRPAFQPHIFAVVME